MRIHLNMFINNLNKLKTIALVFPFLLGVIACDNKDDTTIHDELTVDEIVDQGWNYFSESDYTSALEEFETAIGRGGKIADAYNGAGWSAGKIIDLANGLERSATNFSQSLSIDTTMYDALGGWAFIAFQQGEWTAAIEKADSLLNRRPGWRFLHQSTIDFQDLRLLKAKSYFNNLDFNSSYQVITDFLNPSFVADVSTEEGRMELQQEIERLRLIYG